MKRRRRARRRTRRGGGGEGENGGRGRRISRRRSTIRRRREEEGGRYLREGGVACGPRQARTLRIAAKAGGVPYSLAATTEKEFYLRQLMLALEAFEGSGSRFAATLAACCWGGGLLFLLPPATCLRGAGCRRRRRVPHWRPQVVKLLGSGKHANCLKRFCSP